MQSIKRKQYKLLFVLLALLMLVITVIGGRASSAFADTSSDIVRAYESRNVLEDLSGSTIDGEPFDLKNYPFDSNGDMQLFQFVEFCFSYDNTRLKDYGLYVYVYNPRGLSFYTVTSENKIQLSCGNDKEYYKYPLKFLNMSTRLGYEGLFYKFKVELTTSQRDKILGNLNSSEREYRVSGIELLEKGALNATENKTALTYYYTGYAKGYGSADAENNTLSCRADSLTTISLDVHHTFYRPKGDYYAGEQSQLNSCFFRVPNKYFEDYGELTKIVCEWYEYFTKPILVAQDSYTVNSINLLHGANMSELRDDMCFIIDANYEVYSKGSFLWVKSKGANDNLFSNYDFAGVSDYFWHKGAKYPFHYSVDDHTDQKNFAAAFYTGKDVSYEDYRIDGDALKERLLYNSKYLGGEMIQERYSKALFEDFVEDGSDLGYNRKEVNADEFQDVFWNITTQKWWERTFTGKINVDTRYDSLNAIVTISDIDLKGSDSMIAGSLYIDEKDVSTLKEEYAKAQKNNETVVLLRYSTTLYFCAPAAEGYSNDSLSYSNAKDVLAKNIERIVEDRYNAYVAQETVYLDFDIISLTFTKDDVETVIPVVMSPQDVVSDITPPLEENYHTGRTWYEKLWDFIVGIVKLPAKLVKAISNFTWWQWLLFILGVLILIGLIAWIVITTVKKGVIAVFEGIGLCFKKLAQGFWWLICAPFRGLKALFTRKNKNE